jgi:hypothetical protein
LLTKENKQPASRFDIGPDILRNRQTQGYWVRMLLAEGSECGKKQKWIDDERFYLHGFQGLEVYEIKKTFAGYRLKFNSKTH